MLRETDYEVEAQASWRGGCEGSQIKVLVLNPFIGCWEGAFLTTLPIETQCSIVCYYASKNKNSSCHVRLIKGFSAIPEQTFLFYYRSGEKYFCALALSHHDMQSFFRATQEAVMVSVNSGKSRRANFERPVVVTSSAKTLSNAFSGLMSAALKLSGGVGELLSSKPVLPEYLHKLGWSSSLTMGKNVNHKRVLDSIKALVDQGVSVHHVMIGQGWQDLDPGKLSLKSFRASKERFPQDLIGLITELKALGVRYIGVAHEIMGAEGGVSLELAKSYDFPPDAQGRFFPGYDLGRTFEFFYDFYHYLRTQGVSYVKVIEQSAPLEFCRPGMDVTKLYQNLQEAIQAAVCIQFNYPHHNADCLHAQNLFYWSTSCVAKPALDVHCGSIKEMGYSLFCQLQIAQWLKYFMIPDMGEWVTRSQVALTVSSFLALSGGVYALSDLSGGLDKCLLDRMVLPSGSILISDNVLSLTEESLFVDPIKDLVLYKAWLEQGTQKVLWVGNLHGDERGISGTISLKDFPVLEAEEYCAYSLRGYYQGVVSINDVIKLRVKPSQTDIWTFSPLSQGVAVLGFPRFFLMGACISQINLEENYLHIRTTVYGPFLVFSQKKILEVRCDGVVVPCDYDPEKCLLFIDEHSPIIEKAAEIVVYFE